MVVDLASNTLLAHPRRPLPPPQLHIGTIVLTSKSLLSHSRQDEPAAGDGYVIVCTASSALHRLRSLSLTRLRSGDFFFNPATAAAAAHPKSGEINTPSPKTEVVEKKDEHFFCRNQSETLLQPAEKGESPVRTMKSASERSVRGTFEKKKAVMKEKAAKEEMEGGVDARADDFINSFRRQLRLQRLDSLLNYTEMLNRGK